ncbi:MAG: aldo/keto reductase [Chloroflexi bacterium]|nr:aldo/keto reductase [Chloroflexota bacterium]|tara:strand:+ start:10097 stop:11050 length:954 start_codon:yes stop_codon:yes gene_type:complete
MEMSYLGNTGLKVSRLGIGLAEIGYQLTTDNVLEAGKVLNTALDNGINFLDTASCYGLSEDGAYGISEKLIGKTVSGRRNEYILATKCGHYPYRKKLEDHPKSWLASTVELNINQSLSRLKTDYVDLLQIHSCSLDVLKKGEIIEGLIKIKESGKTRFIGYAGDNEAAAYAMSLGVFDTLQTSYNLVDQKARLDLFPLIKKQNLGLIVKRPIANAAWRSKKKIFVGFSDYFDDSYKERANEMIALGPLSNEPDNSIELALGYALSEKIVDTAIVGTKDDKHLLSNINLVKDGINLDKKLINELKSRFDKLGDNWIQM